MSDTNHSLFDCRNKIFCFSEKELKSIKSSFPEEDLFDLYLIDPESDNQRICAVDEVGKKHSLFGPANGAVVMIDGTGANEEKLDTVVNLWKNAGIEIPASIKVTDPISKHNALDITKLLVTKLSSELESVSLNAVSLDEQIAVLRADLEDYRRNVEEMVVAERLSGNFPSLTFERQPTRSSIKLTRNQLSQLLPYSGNMLSALSVYLVGTDQCSGAIRLSVKAREDGEIVERWEVQADNLSNGWNNFALNSRISSKYRFLDLLIEWMGFDEDTPLSDWQMHSVTKQAT